MNLKKDCLAEEKAMRYIHRLATFATISFVLLLFWALLLKFSNYDTLLKNYQKTIGMTTKELFLDEIVPFRVTADHKNRILQIIANGFVFAPFGVLFQYFFKKENIWRDLTICFGVSLCIEVAQLFTLFGGFATTDLIMNTLGYFVGLAGYRLVFEKMSLRRTIRFYRVVNVIATLLLAVAIFNIIKSRDLLVAILTRRL